MKTRLGVLSVLVLLGCLGFIAGRSYLARQERRFIQRRLMQIESSFAQLARNKEFLRLRLQQEIAKQQELLLSKTVVEKEIVENNAFIEEQRRELERIEESLQSLQQQQDALSGKIQELEQTAERGGLASPARQTVSGNKGYIVRDGRLTHSH